MVAAYIQGGTIILSSNIFKSHPDSRARENRIHAEHAVLRHVEDGAGGRLFVFRATASGQPAMARPCEHCMNLIREKRIRKIWYSTSDGYVKETLQY